MGALLALTLALACDQTPDPEDWSAPEDCAALTDVAWRDECFATIAPAIFREDPAAGEAMMEQISDATVRDYVYLALTREVDPSTRKWCVKIVSAPLKGRCEALVRRPHLHRELVGEPPPSEE